MLESHDFRSLSRVWRLARPAARHWLTACLVFVASFACGQTVTEMNWEPSELAECRRNVNVTLSENGGLTLHNRELIKDEIGRTVHVESSDAAESVHGDTWVRKDFELSLPEHVEAELSVFVNGRVKLTINGSDILPYDRLHTRAKGYGGVYPKNKFPKGHAMHAMNGQPYREFWQGGWERIPLPSGILTNGLNSVIMQAAGKTPLRFLIEPSLHPNRSAVSRDGGVTWDYDNLSSSRQIDGEYVVRLLLERYPASGWVESEPVDMWPRIEGSHVAIPSTLKRLKRTAAAEELPDGTSASLHVRVGTTPEFSPSTWSRWLPIAAFDGSSEDTARTWDAASRFMQWRIELAASPDRLRAPVLKRVALSAELQRRNEGAELPPLRLTQRKIVRPTHHFTHAGNTKRTRLLRAQAELDALVEGKQPGVPAMLALASWVNKSYGGNAPGALKAGSNWDGLLIWHNARGDGRLLGHNCVTRAALFVQCAAALGYPARMCVWSHAIAEVWIEDMGKWVAFDPSGGFYFEMDGQPAGMTEISLAWKGETSGKPDSKIFEIKADGKKVGPKENSSLSWFSRFWIPMRSNFLNSPEPMEPGHGSTGFKYDGDLHWYHPAKDLLPWFSFGSGRRGDFEFSVNTANLHLSQGIAPGTVEVAIECDSPRPARFEARFGGGEWAAVERNFVWNTKVQGAPLEVRPITVFGLPGATARVEEITAETAD